MTNGVLERAAKTARDQQASTWTAKRRILKAHGLSQTDDAVWQLTAEITQQEPVTLYADRSARLTAGGALNARRIPAGWDRRAVLREYRASAARPVPPLAERLAAFRIAEFERRASEVLRGVANVDLTVTVGDPAVAYRRVWDGQYSYNYPYPKVANRYRVAIPKHWRSRVLHQGLAAVIGATLVVDAEPIPGEHNAYNAVWTARRRTELRLERGVVLKAGARLIHGRDLGECRKVLKRLDAEEVRSQRVVPTDPDELIRRFGSVRVFPKDSIRAGNCPTGTQSWIAAHFPGRRSATVAEVLAVEQSVYTIAACVRAVRRRG